MSANNSNGLTVRVATATTDTVSANDDVIVYTAGTAKTVTIPAEACRQPGKVFRFTNLGAGDATVAAAVGQINGQSSAVATAVASNVPGRLSIVFNGTNWYSL